jgi:rod shape determining protein RodA
MKGRRLWRHFDFVLLGAAVVLTLYGVVMIHSANQGSLDPQLLGEWSKQAILGLVGVGLVFLIAAFPRDYTWLADLWLPAYLTACALLVLALIFGTSQVGQVSGWLYLGPIGLQPSYIAMNLLTISVAAVLGHGRRKRKASQSLLAGVRKSGLSDVAAERPGARGFLVSGLLALALAALVFLEPDMATAAVLVSMWAAMLLESRVPARYLVFTGLAAMIAVVPLWHLMDRFPYMRERVIGFLSPAAGSGATHQVNQALIAIGSGGFWGKGLGQGTQSQLRYLPVRHTDFIFSVLAEELGFAGVMFLFALYLVLFLRLIRIILIAPDLFGKLLVTGTLAMILFQMTVNVGMNLGMLPVAGLPLPFISYGPNALLATMIGIGIAENVAMRHRRLEF